MRSEHRSERNGREQTSSRSSHQCQVSCTCHPGAGLQPQHFQAFLETLVASGKGTGLSKVARAARWTKPLAS